jgi:nucleoside-diphosphate-sugar epimerase
MGYLGSLLSRSLGDKSHYVVGLDQGYFSGKLIDNEFLPEVFISQQIYKDIREVDVSDIRGFDAVVQLAAISNDPIGNKYEAATEAINYSATKKLLDLCIQEGVNSYVFASSCSMYGNASNASKAEGDELQPLTAYARSKVAIEKYAESTNLKTTKFTALRFATACGPSPRFRVDLVLNDFIYSALNCGVIEILSDGTPLRPLIDTRDMVKSIIWAIDRPEHLGKFLAVNAGRNDWNFNVLRLAEIVSQIIPNSTINLNPNGKGDPRSYVVDFSKFEKLAPGIFDARTIESTIQDTVALLGGGAKIKSYKKTDYIRLATLEEHMERGNLNNNFSWVFG